MKMTFSLIGALLLSALLITACRTVAPTPAQPSITFENDKCTYTGPKPIPAGISTTVNWVIKDKDRTKYGLYVFTLDAGKTEQDLMASANDPYPPSWSHIVGSSESAPNKTMQASVNTTKGPLYFTCWFSPPDTMFQIIGPVAVTGTNP